jgi:hypothetical protein
MPTPVSSIRNLGPASDASFARAGITSAEELREMGADAAYRHLLTHGTRPHFIGYYCIVMGLQGRPWNDCKGKEKDELRARFDAIVASVQKDKTAVPLGIEAILNDIGTGLRR